MLSRISWFQAVSVRGVAFSAILGVLIGIAITKPQISINSGIVCWLLFVVLSILFIDTANIPTHLLSRAKVATIPSVGLVGCLVFKFGLHFLLFTYQGTPFVIMGSGIGFDTAQAKKQEIKVAIRGVDWALDVLAKGKDCQAASDALREMTKIRIIKNIGEDAFSTNCHLVREFLKKDEKPQLSSKLKDLQNGIDNQPSFLLSMQNKTALVVAFVFYGLIAVVTPLSLIILFPAKPDLNLIVKWFKETTPEELIRIEKKLIGIGKIIAVALALFAILF